MKKKAVTYTWADGNTITYDSIRSAAKALNVNPSNLCKFLSGKRTYLKGLQFVDVPSRPNNQAEIIRLHVLKWNRSRKSFGQKITYTIKQYKREQIILDRNYHLL